MHDRFVTHMDQRQLGLFEVSVDVQRVLIDERRDAFASRDVVTGCKSKFVIGPLTDARTADRSRLSFAKSRSASA